MTEVPPLTGRTYTDTEWNDLQTRIKHQAQVRRDTADRMASQRQHDAKTTAMRTLANAELTTLQRGVVAAWLRRLADTHAMGHTCTQCSDLYGAADLLDPS